MYRTKSFWISVFISSAVGLLVILHVSMLQVPPPLSPFIQGDGFYIYRGEVSKRQSISIQIPAEGPSGLPVTEIAANAFKNFKNLKTVEIPDTIIEIHDNAFRGCIALESVYIPDSVTKIGHSAFRDCVKLEMVTGLNSVAEISAYMFMDCPALKEITLPESVRAIHTQAFFGASLKEITILYSGVVSIAGDPFAKCPIDRVWVRNLTVQGQYHSLPTSSNWRPYLSPTIKIWDVAYKP